MGEQYNFLTIVSFSHIQKGQYYWNCLCDCGNYAIVSQGNLAYGATKSCGCKKGVLISNSRWKHDFIDHPLYSKWTGMKSRCSNPKDQAYKDYGGRGIIVCEEWKKDFIRFYDWCINNAWKHGLEIDRRNNDGNYSPDNCRFVTTRVNSFNKRNTAKIFFNGKLQSFYDLELSTGIRARILWRRVNELNWDIERAISIPIRLRRKIA